jgi:3'(2'), 5'-bisphosphate nucleotidase
MHLHDYAREIEVACRLARQAGALAMAHYGGTIQVDFKDGDPANPVTQADRDTNQLIVSGLQAAFPDDAILAEEAPPDARRHQFARLWCVDPIDGTRDFIERTGQFVVMIGLAIDGTAQLGVVYQPTSQTLWWGVGQTACMEDAQGGKQPLRVTACGDPRQATLMASRAHASRAVLRTAEALGIRRHRAMGSVGLKMAELACGRADIYLSITNKTHEWDACGPEAILKAAGGTVTDLLGQPLRYNKPDTRTERGILGSNGPLHPACVAALRPILKERGWLAPG